MTGAAGRERDDGDERGAVPALRPDRVIAELASHQHGVVSRAQLLACGLGAQTIRTRTASGRLTRIHAGVYTVDHAITRQGRWMAALLATGSTTVLSHHSAAVLHGLLQSDGPRTDVTTAIQTAARRDIAIHRTRRTNPADVTRVDGIPVTTVARTLVDLASTIPADHLAKAIREADRLDLLDLHDLDRVAAAARNAPGRGHARLTAALEEIRAIGVPTRSPLEDAFLRLIRRARLPRPAVNAQVEGFEVDALWPLQRVVVELDGWAYHRSRTAFHRDRSRDRALTAAGYRVLRFTHADLARHPDELITLLTRVFTIDAGITRDAHPARNADPSRR